MTDARVPRLRHTGSANAAATATTDAKQAPTEATDATDPTESTAPPSPDRPPPHRQAPGRRERHPIWALLVEALAATAHALHGTRGIGLGVVALLLLALLEPALAADVEILWLIAPVTLVLMVGLFTLPREAVAVQRRARQLVQGDRAARLSARWLLWPAALLVLLVPRIFLAGYGVPHFSPLAGLLLPNMVQRVALVFLFSTLLVPVLMLRASKRLAPDIKASRPRDLSHDDFSHEVRDVLLVLLPLLVILWAWLLRPFWSPFSLLQWPPSVASLTGVRGVVSIAFSILLPALLYVHLTAQLALLRDLYVEGMWKARGAVVAIAMAHVAVALGAVVLHAYDLLWIVRYELATSL